MENMNHKPTMMFYHDGRHPLIYMYEPPMQVEQYQQAVDELIGTPIQSINFCMGDGRTVLHDTQVGELWGANQDRWPHIIFRRAYQNASHLIETGNDPLRIISERAHEKGFFYPTLLVQQDSGDPERDTRGSTFRFTHKHLDIGAAGDIDRNYGGFDCADFKHEKIRNERVALIEETLRKYPCDGFELQMNYSPYYFHPNKVKDGIPIMTRWIERVTHAVRSSGANRVLIVRIPASIKGCLAIGMDIIDWIDKGLVDVLVAQDFSGSESLTCMSHFRELVEALPRVTTPGFWPPSRATWIPTVLPKGVSRWSGLPLRTTGCRALMDSISPSGSATGLTGHRSTRRSGNFDPEVMAAKDKIYALPTISQHSPNPATEPDLSIQHTRDLHAGKTEHFTITISDDLPRWHRVDRVHKVLLRIRIMGMTELDRIRFDLNGKTLPDNGLRKINAVYRMNAPRYRVGSGYWFIFDLAPDHWPVQGDNDLAITHDIVDEIPLEQALVRDIECDIRYLMGMNFHRELVDDDLGPCEVSGP